MAFGKPSSYIRKLQAMGVQATDKKDVKKRQVTLTLSFPCCLNMNKATEMCVLRKPNLATAYLSVEPGTQLHCPCTVCCVWGCQSGTLFLFICLHFIWVANYVMLGQLWSGVGRALQFYAQAVQLQP